MLPEEYTKARKEREDEGDGGWVLLVRENLNFLKILVDDQFKQHLVGKVVTLGNKTLKLS